MSYDDDVDTWTLAAVRAGPTSFDDLICHLPGVYPTDVCAALARLHAGSAITGVELDRAQRRQPRPTFASPPSTLPVPHPLDFDWRFTPAALAALVAACDRGVGKDACIVCIGAPSLHEWLVAGRTTSTLLDANDEMVAALSLVGPGAICLRLGCDPLPEVVADAVVIDPPWYPEHVDLFLWAASQLCADAGVVLLSFPPAGTRPGVAEEREQALSYAATVGLSLVDIRRGELAYRSPPFERVALAATGLVDLPEDWRRGDLLVFRAAGGRPTNLAPPASVADDTEWVSVPASPTRIKVRHTRERRPCSAQVQPRLGSIVAGDVLPTVSRRDPRRARAAVWTACNRVFSCGDTAVFAAIADARMRGGNAIDAVAETIGRELAGGEEARVRDTVGQLDELVRLETADLEEFGWVARRR